MWWAGAWTIDGFVVGVEEIAEIQKKLHSSPLGSKPSIVSSPLFLGLTGLGTHGTLVFKETRLLHFVLAELFIHPTVIFCPPEFDHFRSLSWPQRDLAY